MQRYYTLCPSRQLSLSLSLLCGLLLIPLWMLSSMAMTMALLAVIVLCWGGYHLLLDANLRLQHSCMAFRLEEHEEIVLVLRNGRHLQGRLSPDSLVTPWLVILNVVLSEQRGGRSLVLLPDGMKGENFRRLRVALRWGHKSHQAGV